jgi:hypothetical protein
VHVAHPQSGVQPANEKRCDEGNEPHTVTGRSSSRNWRS